MTQLILVTDDVRSTHNVGSLFRTCDGLGVTELQLCGITPYPIMQNDTRLPYIAEKAHKQIHKTALGAEETVAWKHVEAITDAINTLKNKGWRIVALEQNTRSVPLDAFIPPQKIVLVVGTEVTGLNEAVISLCDDVIEIPMLGVKESFNVSVAAAIAMYKLLS